METWCEECGDEVSPRTTYGHYPSSLCFNCWTDSQQEGQRGKDSVLKEAEEKVGVRRRYITECENELRDAEKALDEAESELGVLQGNRLFGCV
jgi:hypothetical protein